MRTLAPFGAIAILSLCMSFSSFASEQVKTDADGYTAIFDGKSLIEIWDNITIIDINGCDPDEMIKMYLLGSGGLEAPQ